ncbi:Gfo/Idh/MocA family protein [Rhodopseudomonas palustris]
MKVLIVGYGSIGARHARLAAGMGHSISCVTRNKACPHPGFRSVSEALRWGPDKIIVSNQTSLHAATLTALDDGGYRGDVLMEKPLFGGAEPPRVDAGLRVFVAFNLRFHPLIQRLKHLIQGMPLYTATFLAGQYLPDWRPQSDYRASYSAFAAEGGGVLRDLSHELDLAQWLCGGWRRVGALGGHLSDLEIDSDDVFSLLVEGEACPVIAVNVNYLDRIPRRQILLNGRGVTACLDMVSGTLNVNGDIEVATVDRDQTYLMQLAAFLSGDHSNLCSQAEALRVDRLIAMAERAAATGCWQAV